MELFLTSRKRCDFPFIQLSDPVDLPISIVNIALGLAEEDKKRPLVLVGNEPALHPDLEQILTQCEKHSIQPVLETNGLFSDSAKQLIIKKRPIISWRIYRPELYSKEDMEEAAKTLQDLLDARLQVQFVLYMDDPNADYSFIEKRLDIFENCLLLLRTNCMFSISDMQKLVKNNAEMVKNLALGGKDIVFDCHFMPCAFEDATFGMIYKLGIQRVGCSPHLLVMPNGHFAHCRFMTIVQGPLVSTFKSHAQLIKYYYDVFRQMQVTVPENTPCFNCISRKASLCTGFNMATKATALLQEKEKLIPLFEQEEYAEGDKHLALLWRMASIGVKLGFHNDVIECLEEVRRLTPEDPKVHYWLACSYWEVERRSDAEEEFRKCSRLTPSNPIAALAELHKRFVENGNTIRAHMLAEEIKKLIANQQAAAQKSDK